MIIVRLTGGLGNQMFQYAAGLRLALERGVELKLDITRLSGESYRKYQLGVFNIRESFATEREIRKVKFGSLSTWIFLPFRPLLGVRFLPPTFYQERSYRFDPSVLELGNKVYMKGRYHSEKYFASIASTVAERYTLTSPSEKAAALAEVIRSCESVSVHVRRGDYLSSPKNLERYGNVDDRYYEECVKRVLERSPSARFFVFSDEPGWVRRNMAFPESSTFVDPEGLGHDAEEMYLMSCCRTHITANSTFSWWGAWLDRRPEKIVYTPKNWFRARDLDTADLLPEDWVKV